ncbi:MAG: hypothetical protein IKZ82_01740 [Clostridia bacterium]|nr:hypothetical protein [Clostridia bacterium]
MNTKEFAKKHGVKTDWVRERCKEGLIPSAEKKNGRWDIPENAELPPCTGREAALILENIIERAKGIEVRLVPARMAERGEAALEYLMNWGFIAKSGEDGALRAAKRGLELLERLGGSVGARRGGKERSKKKKTAFSAGASVDVNLAVISAHGEVNYRSETEEVPTSEKPVPDEYDKKAG